MPWEEIEGIHIDDSVIPSFMPNNLKYDGAGRMAFVHGQRIYCTPNLAKGPGRSYNLAFSEKLEVTSVFWWTGQKAHNRALLVFTTEATKKTPSTLQIWNASRGSGSRIFRCNVNEFEVLEGCAPPTLDTDTIQFARGLAQASSSATGQLLFCGVSNGSVFGIASRDAKEGGFRLTCAVRDLTHPIIALAGDKNSSSLLAASDEAGIILVWQIKEELDRDGTNLDRYRCSQVYRYILEDDFCNALGVKGKTVVAGHASGYLTFHDIEQEEMTASVVSNTKAVTGIDIYEHKDLVLVVGEDCRVTVLGFSSSRLGKPSVYFSVALDAVVIGCSIYNSTRGYPRISALTWQKQRIVQFEYKKARKEASRTRDQESASFSTSSKNNSAQDGDPALNTL